MTEREWRVGHRGRDQMYYEERHGLTWERIEIDGEMLMGEAHHVIYFASPERWRSYPPWARDRRDEIIARITSEFRPPDYEYHGLSTTQDTTSSAPAPSVPPAGATGRKSASRPLRNNALLIALLVLFVIAATMGWLVTTGVARGETRLPLKQSSLRRAVSREHEPVMFWVSISIYAALGGVALTLGVLGIREGRKE